MPDWLIPLLTLTAMEIVLGVDNIIVLTIMVSKLPVHKQKLARQLGLGAALGTRLILLFFLSWLAGLKDPIFHWTSLGISRDFLKPEVRVHDPKAPFDPHEDEHPPLTEAQAEAKLRERDGVSVRDLILILGGLFLIWKSVSEIHDKLEESRSAGRHDPTRVPDASFGMVITQIAIMDIVFSLDSVITAIGMARQIWVMVVAMVIAMVVMFVAAGPIGRFVMKHPTVKMLALSFLILIGVLLVADGFGTHIERGYIYSAMGFSIVVELLNLRLRPNPHTDTLPIK
jgi:predicted tellurium resistance membrane protein TerC